MTNALANHQKVRLVCQVLARAERGDRIWRWSRECGVDTDMCNDGAAPRELRIAALEIGRRILRDHGVARRMQDRTPLFLPGFVIKGEAKDLRDHVVANKERGHAARARVIGRGKQISLQALTRFIEKKTVVAGVAIAVS